ncbi:MAG: FAD-dependent monooxygenase [Chloroflexota bacterium]
MRYDLIVVGGGPGGLMAAKTAAEDGLKVLMVERKKRITEINRACSQIFYVRKVTGSGTAGSGKTKSDGYIDPVSVEVQADKTIFHFYTPGFSLDYIGPLRPYLNWIHFSPGGNLVHRYPLNERPWGFFYHKEAFVTQLLAAVEKAGAEVRAETTGLGAENIAGGVRVRLRGPEGEEMVEARAAIAADGLLSQVVEGVGLNQNRPVLMRRRSVFLQYIMEGVETGYPTCSWLTWLIPTLNPFGFIAIGQSEENRVKVGTFTSGDCSPEAILDGFIKHPNWAYMFRKAKIVKREATGRSVVYGPISEPVLGNVVVVGDAGAVAETWTQGAVACGFQAVKAIKKELNGQKGYPDYVAWWKQAFAFNTPDYIKMISEFYPLPQICTDEEMDYIYSLCQGEIGIPQKMVAEKLDRIKAERPSLYEKLTRKKA